MSATQWLDDWAPDCRRLAEQKKLCSAVMAAAALDEVDRLRALVDELTGWLDMVLANNPRHDKWCGSATKKDDCDCYLNDAWALVNRVRREVKP